MARFDELSQLTRNQISAGHGQMHRGLVVSNFAIPEWPASPGTAKSNFTTTSTDVNSLVGPGIKTGADQVTMRWENKKIRLTRENNQEIIFAHRWVGNWYGLAVGAALFYLSWVAVKYNGIWGVLPSVFTLVLGFLFVRSGVSGFFWREELHFDLVSHQCLWKKGFWSRSMKTSERPFSSLQGVQLDEGVVVSARFGGGGPAWDINLVFKDKEQVTVANTNDEREAYLLLEHFSTKLRVPAILNSDDKVVKVEWNDLRRHLAKIKKA